MIIQAIKRYPSCWTKSIPRSILRFEPDIPVDILVDILVDIRGEEARQSVLEKNGSIQPEDIR